MQILTIYIDFKGKMVGIWLLFTDKLITCGQKWLFLTLVDISKKWNGLKHPWPDNFSWNLRKESPCKVEWAIPPTPLVYA